MPIHMLALILGTAGLPMRTLPDSAPSCDSVLTGLAAKTEANYAGFLLEYQGSRRKAYESRLREAHREARTSDGGTCFFVLDRYIKAFNDPHLFVFQNLYRDTLDIQRAAATRRPVTLPYSEDRVRAYLIQNARHLDPLEGIWTDGKLRVGIILIPHDPAPTLDAIVLTSDTVLWQPGEVRASFGRNEHQSYRGRVHERNLASRFVTATIYKRNLLRFDPGMWAREYPIAPADSGLVSTIEPHDATMIWRGQTPVLSIPSHDPDHRARLNALIDSNAAAIRVAPRFIIDLRGNEGGASWVTDSLLPLIAGPLRAHQPARLSDGQILSSPDQIEYVKNRWFNISSDSASIARLLARIEAHPGALVPLQDSIDAAREAASRPAALPDSAGASGPRVGILIDGGTVSASEVLVLDAMRYARVTVFGEHTAGALDYQSVSIARIGDSARRWYLGYPTITASPLLPKGGMRGKGIQPDRKVDWRKIADPIGYVDRALKAEDGR